MDERALASLQHLDAMRKHLDDLARFIETALREHAAVDDAIAQHDPDAAERAVTGHMSAAGERLAHGLDAS